MFDDLGQVDFVLQDDGKAPDKKKGDKKYSAYTKQDTDKLVAAIVEAEETLKEKEVFLVFAGHTGRMMGYNDIVKFDKQAFAVNEEVEVSIHLKDAESCSADLLKERSLFITDLSVVEDQSRTYNVATEVGNPTGAWTFGTLMANMENGMHADGVRGFLKHWVKHWVTAQTVNGYVVPSRDFVMVNLIEPWLVKANPGVSIQVDLTTWEGIWDNTPVANIRKFAPFKLTAIVNRLDLRGNSAYATTMGNTGETRFIYTLIDPVTGAVPINPNQTASHQVGGPGFFDWRGMNVILEYGNPQTTRCELKDFALAWLELSDPTYVFGSAASNNPYKDALQAITDQVTLPNTVPNKVNGSAINRIRTNEKAFATFNGMGQTSEEAWEQQDWEFRQFELNSATHGLAMVPLTNNPDHTANFAPNIQEDGYGSGQQVSNNDILDWIFSGHRFQVLNGNFNLPTSLLSGAGLVRREQAQFFDLEPGAFATAGGYDPLNESLQAKQIRQQLSVNTCAGCHAGETKTVFTHVNALAYGESARYWPSTLDGASNIQQDANLYPWGDTDPLQLNGKNNGTTLVPPTDLAWNFTTEDEVRDRRFFQHVSAFLTGRRFVQNQQPPGTWQDDELDDVNVEGAPLGDNSAEGLFYVNDPSNDADLDFPYESSLRPGFNDLLMRRNALCQFVNQSCITGPGISSTMGIMAELAHIPLPLGGH